MTAANSNQKRSTYVLVAIGLFKLVKSILLLVLGIWLVRLRNQDLGQAASQWIDAVWLGRPFVDRMIESLSRIDPKTLEQLSAGSFIYAGLLLVEGIGLCRRKRWAEFLTVGITASLLPLEFYELFHRLTAIRIAITVVNIAILWYLVVHLIHDRRLNS